MPVHPRDHQAPQTQFVPRWRRRTASCGSPSPPSFLPLLLPGLIASPHTFSLARTLRVALQTNVNLTTQIHAPSPINSTCCQEIRWIFHVSGWPGFSEQIYWPPRYLKETQWIAAEGVADLSALEPFISQLFIFIYIPCNAEEPPPSLPREDLFPLVS